MRIKAYRRSPHHVKSYHVRGFLRNGVRVSAHHVPAHHRRGCHVSGHLR